jgi:hypothetical protein
MACCSPAKTEQLESKKAETVKALCRGGESLSKLAFVPHTRGRSALASLRFVHNHLRRRSTTADSSCGELAHFELRAHFLGLGHLLVETRSKLRNPCAEVHCCSWSQREGRVSDRKTGMCCKRIVDDKIPSLASAFAQS